MENIKILITIGLYLFFLSTPSEARKLRTRTTSKLEMSNLYYPHKIPTTETSSLLIHGELNTTLRWRPLKAIIQPVGEYEYRNNGKKYFFYDIPNGYIEWKAIPFVLKAGNQIYNWGVADGINPVDVLNPKYLRNPLHAKKLGTPSASLKWSKKNTSVEMVYIPRQRKGTLPDKDSRWLPRGDILKDPVKDPEYRGIEIKLPEEIFYHYETASEIDNSLDHNYALRFQTFLGDIDFSFIYFEGAPSLPFALFEVTSSGHFDNDSIEIEIDKDITIIPTFFKKRIYGATLVFTIDKLIVRYEGAFNQQISQDSILPGHFHEHILALEYPLSIGDKDIRLLAQATYLNYTSKKEGNSSTSLNRVFDQALLMGAYSSLSENMSILATAMWDIKHKGFIYNLNIDYKLLHSLNTTLSGTFLDDTSTDTPIGANKKNAFYTFNLKWHF